MKEKEIDLLIELMEAVICKSELDSQDYTEMHRAESRIEFIKKELTAIDNEQQKV